MESQEFIEQVKNSKIKNGSKFEVYNSNNEVIGIVGVIDTTVVYLDIKDIPEDLYIGNYTFKLIEE